MKFTFLFLVCFTLFSSAYSQITVTNDDIAPAGTTIYDVFDTIPADNIIPGNAGSNQTWVFHNLNQHGVDTITYMLPEWTPYASDFPNANFAAESTAQNGFSYFIRNNSEISNIGLATNHVEYGLLLLDVQPEEIIMDFPVQYGDTREEDFFFIKTMGSTSSGIDSIKIKRSTHKLSNVDAYGTIDLDFGIYDVLRIKENRTIEDSIWLKIPVVGWTLYETTITTTLTYSWITNDISVGYTLLSMNIDTETSDVTKVSYLTALPTNIASLSINKAAVFPNPAKDVVYIKLEKPINVHLFLFDNYGRIVLQKKISDDKALFSFSITALPSGLYYYKIIKQRNGKTICSGKIIKR